MDILYTLLFLAFLALIVYLLFVGLSGGPGVDSQSLGCLLAWA